MKLWMILLPSFLAILLLMRLATGKRGKPFLNKEDHRASTIGGFILAFLAYAAITVFCPFEMGALTVAGFLFIVLAAVIYLSALATLSKSESGLVTGGIYRRTRNPMYLAMMLYLLSFSLMATQARPLAGLALAACSLLFLVLIKKRVSDEEAFLSQKYPEAWASYCARTPRFLPFLARHA